MLEKRKRKGTKIRMPGTKEHNVFKSKRAPPLVMALSHDDETHSRNTIVPFPRSPNLHSFRVQPADSASKLERMAMEWICEDLLTILYERDSIVPVLPYCNSLRMCHQTPQAMRLFFSASAENNDSADQVGKVPNTTDDLPKIPINNLVVAEFGPNASEILPELSNHYEKQALRSNDTFQNVSKHNPNRCKNKLQKRSENIPARKKTKAKAAAKSKQGDTERLYSYGLLAVLNTTGFHPSRDVKVRPYCEKLKAIVELLTEEVKKHLEPNAKYRTNDLDFNHLEIKIYHGKDVFRDQDGCPLLNKEGKEIRDDCNKVVNFHNDVCFSDEGIQSANDTARGDHPIATLTVGAPRKLTFVHKWKTVGSKWSNGETVDFELDQGSIFCLLPDDEIPSLVEDRLHKTQHMAKFSKKGISIALVFRSIRTTSVFDKKTHRWKWKVDHFYRRRVRSYLKKNSERYKNTGHNERSSPKEAKEMMKNVSQFLSRLKAGQRFVREEKNQKS